MAALLAAGPIQAQYHPGGSEIEADPDSLLDAGLDEILSYLLLNRDDFRFRDDYLEKDSFRLPLIDSLMFQPLMMNDLTDKCRSDFDIASNDPDGMLEFIAGRAGAGYRSGNDFSDVIDYLFPRQSEEDDDRPAWMAARDTLTAILHGWSSYSSRYISNVLDDAAFEAVVEKYKNLILEEVAEKDKSAREQDSVSKIEERFAIDFRDMAAGLDFPEIAGLSGVLRQLEIIRQAFEGEDILKDLAHDRPLYARRNDEDKIKIVIGGLGSDVYRGNYDLIIDPGGNDSYYLSYDPLHPHATIVADFSGDDVYAAETDFALACGAFSMSLLIDYEGDDIYRGGSFSLGAGYFGVGILWDKEGNDSYIGDTFTQGAGTFGLGLLIDSDGSDTYSGNLFCQGFGFVNGVGGIIDNDGNDNYIVQPKYGDYIRYEDHYISLSQGFGYGIRPWLSGGWGFIFDYSGNDNYVSDIFGQGASYWWSLGMLYDGSGNDQYISHQYAQGNGTHMSLGILRDDAGNDIYRAYGVSQGCGHDYSLGWLQDRGGDDLYATYDLGHGAGQANGMGLLTDLTGNDRYYVVLKRNTQGYGNPRRDYGSIGIFLDLDGDDRYDGNGENNRFWTLPGSKWGGGLDRHIPIGAEQDTTEAENE